MSTRASLIKIRTKVMVAVTLRMAAEFCNGRRAIGLAGLFNRYLLGSKPKMAPTS